MAGAIVARQLIEVAVSTPAARKRLSNGVHWRRIDAEVHLGYRKGNRSGVWLVRWRSGAGYRQAPIGAADDVVREGTLSFAAAEGKAREHVESARAGAKAAASGELLTIRSAVESYVGARDVQEGGRLGSIRSDVGQRLGRYVLGAAFKRGGPRASFLAEIPLHQLTEDHLREWRSGLPVALKSSTKQRLINDLRAALNAAYRENRRALPATLPEAIRFGFRVEGGDREEVARENQILSAADIGRLLRAARTADAEGEWDGDLYRLIAVLAATGARFSQVIRLQCRDVHPDRRRILVPASFKGRGGSGGYVNIPVSSDVIEVLAPAITGRDGGATLLERWRFAQAPGGIKWEKDRRGPWKSSSEFTREWSTIRVAAGLPGAIPYAFRHSSIVRGLRANLPIRLVAGLHDTSVAMIEKHYSRWITDGLDDLAASAVVALLPVDADNVISISNAR